MTGYTLKDEEYMLCRMLKHIELVKNFHSIIVRSNFAFDPVVDIRLHDIDKLYNDNVRIPYVFIYKAYREHKKPIDYGEQINNLCYEATLNHIINNPHHCEYWDFAKNGNKDVLISKTNRDGAVHLNYYHNMPIEYIDEMVADWKATATERGNTVLSFANATIGTRWDFTDEQKKRIYRDIELVE